WQRFCGSRTARGVCPMFRVFWNGCAVTVLVAVAACGGGSNPSSPSPSPNPNPSTATVTISGSGVSPKSVQIAVGGHVTFTNNDARSHPIASNPHPVHTDCPEINQVGVLQPGQSRDTGNFSAARSCGYHDHANPSDTTVQGTIVIQ